LNVEAAPKMATTRPMSKTRQLRRFLLRYGVAVFVALVAFRLVIIREVGPALSSVLFFAVLVSSWYGGLGPGLATIVIDTLLLLASFLLLHFHGGIPFQPRWFIWLGLYTAGGVLITLLVEALHSARRRAEQSTEEARRHQETLRASEARLDAILENSPSIVYLKDLEGRYHLVNRRYATLFHVDASAMAGKTDFDVFPAAVAEQFRANDCKVLAARKALEFEEAVPLEDGPHTYLANKFPLFAPDGTIAAICGQLTDITDRKRLELERIDLLERERTARTQAEWANHAKDQFLAVLSHELRTPLTPILATVSAMLAEPGTPPEYRSVFELARWGIELESRLIGDLLDMTEITRGRLRLQPETTDVHVLIHRALEICREEINAAGPEVVVDLSAAHHHVHADPARLVQVFWNLIKNAVKFSPHRGTLTIHTWNDPGRRSGAGPAAAGTTIGNGDGVVDDSDNDNDDSDNDDDGRLPNLVVAISDTGVGIDPEVLPRIFEPFTQGEAGWVRRFGGMGLGLAISRSVLEAHGGRIEAASPGKDQGATLTVTLGTVAEPAPAALPVSVPPQAAVAVARQAGSDPSPPRALKILLVEDDGPTLRVMTRLLGKPPYVVRAANTLALALEIAGAEDFDLIISDIGLPDGSGLELMRQIRDRYASRGIALSGYGMEEDIRKSREAGFVAHLTKPVDFQKLQVTIEQVASNIN
jgi:PAS domain S-box-containing protein